MRTIGLNKRAKQCRERWLQHLCPGIVVGDWSDKDKELLLNLQSRYCNQWKIITEFFPGRTDNQIKNQFFSIIRKMLRKACKFLQLGMKSAGITLIKPRVMAEVANHPMPYAHADSPAETVKEFLYRHFSGLNGLLVSKDNGLDRDQLLKCIEYIKRVKLSNQFSLLQDTQ
jgi:hypothetical protein